MKYFFTIIIFILFSYFLNAQQDSGILPHKDSAGKVHSKNILKKKIIGKNGIKVYDSSRLKGTVKVDSLSPVKIAPLKKDSTINDSVQNKVITTSSKNYDSILATTGLPVFSKPKFMLTPEKAVDTKDDLFCFLAGMVFLLALVRAAFPSYLKNVFDLFFQRRITDVNTRYAAQQKNLAFFLMQLVFICSGAFYITLLSEKYFYFQYPFEEKLLFFSIFIACVYIIKEIVIKILGWVFGLKAEAKIYLLYIFLVNMVLAIVFIPIVLFLTFSLDNDISSSVLMVSYILLAIFYIYRYFLVIKTVQAKLHAKAIQIFLYLCTVEVLPVVLLCKLLFNYTNGLN